jgi:hypothetical protein
MELKATCRRVGRGRGWIGLVLVNTAMKFRGSVGRISFLVEELLDFEKGPRPTEFVNSCHDTIIRILLEGEPPTADPYRYNG